VFATVGFGDISPVSAAALVLASVQMIGDLVLIGLLIKTMLTAVDRGRAQQARGSSFPHAAFGTADVPRTADARGDKPGVTLAHRPNSHQRSWFFGHP
jgi:hypothetical protein